MRVRYGLLALLAAGLTVSCAVEPPGLREETLEPEAVWQIAEDESAPIGQVTGIAGLPDGGVAVLDYSNNQVLLVKPDGSTRVRVGRTGSGPLEFRGPQDIELLRDGLLVNDRGNARFQVLDFDGELLRQFTLLIARPFSSTISVGSGGIYLPTGGLVPGGLIAQYDQDGRFLREIGDLPAEPNLLIDSSEIRDYALRREVHPRFRNSVRAVATSDSSVIAVHTSLPVILKFGPRGDLLWQSELELADLDSLEEANYRRNLQASKYGGVVLQYWRGAVEDGRGGAWLLLMSSERLTLYHVAADGLVDRRLVGPEGVFRYLSRRDGTLWAYCPENMAVYRFRVP